MYSTRSVMSTLVFFFGLRAGSLAARALFFLLVMCCPR
jgi:hypothetical protein